MKFPKTRLYYPFTITLASGLAASTAGCGCGFVGGPFGDDPKVIKYYPPGPEILDARERQATQEDATRALP